MSEPSVFRSADEASDTPNPSLASTDVKDQPIVEGSSKIETHAPELLATYADDIGHPYAANYFDVKDTWDKEASLKYELETIEGYLQKQISRGKLNNSTKAGADFIKSMEKEAKIARYATPAAKISKLVAFIEFKEFVHG